VAICLTLLLIVACSKKSGTDSPTQPTPIGPGTSPVHYTAIAASDGVGFGGSQPCPPLVDCPVGTGYVQVIVRRLRETREVAITNLSLPGAVLSPDIETLATNLGRRPAGNLLQRAAPFVPRETTLVTIFVGGNDANAIAAGAAAQGGDPAAFITAQVQGFARDLGQLLDMVRTRAPSAQVVVLNLPNFAGLPFTQGFSALDRRLIQEASVRLSTEAINPLAGRVSIVDLLCDGRSYVASNYSADGFHPSDSGYAYIADLLWTAIHNGSGHPAPLPSCGPMRIA
jgi:lysophospholipase L1-like esterase